MAAVFCPPPAVVKTGGAIILPPLLGLGGERRWVLDALWWYYTSNPGNHQASLDILGAPSR